MSSPKKRRFVGFCMSILVGCLLVSACQTTSDPTVPGAELPPAGDREALFDYLTQEVDGQPRWQTWPLFPSTIAKAEFELKRIGLPVHGRWVTTHVNPTALTALEAAITPGKVSNPVEMPPGSMIVKANYGTQEEFRPTDEAMVLTVMYKPYVSGPTDCQSGYRTNGKDCFGGEWQWEFFGLVELASHFDALIRPDAFCINCHAPAVESDYLRSLFMQRRAEVPAQIAGVSSAAGPAGSDPFCESVSAASSTLPGDVALNPAKVDDPQRMFDCLSWRSFVALMWPADDDQRGEPDTAFTAPRQAGFFDGERVWETYKETYEVFQPDILDWNPSDPPQPWNQPAPKPIGKGCESVEGAVLPMTTKSRSHTLNVANEVNQAFAGSFGTLKDQNGRLVRYSVRFNRDEFDYILETRSAVTAELSPGGPNRGDAHLPDNVSGRYGGSIEVKAAWRELCLEGDCFPKVDDPSDYYSQPIWIYHPSPDDDPANAICRQATMGLVGLHIAHKTFWAPQWIWTTFEHKDNVPLAGDPTPEATAFFNPECKEPVECWKEPFLISSPCCPNVTLNRFARPANFPPDKTWPGTEAPNQLSRLAPLGGSGLNEVFAQKLAGTPLANYILVNTQWPFNGRSPNNLTQVNTQVCPGNGVGDGCFTMIPTYLRNTVIESYMSTYNFQRQQYSNRSCMECHSAAGADSSYVWLDGVEQTVPIAAGGG